ncbi:MAG: hypothetical protein K8963_02470, partial [Proteobacteria bacterium]|nr:hypothetical protein [Pseudomonadota bacterium]
CNQAPRPRPDTTELRELAVAKKSHCNRFQQINDLQPRRIYAKQHSPQPCTAPHPIPTDSTDRYSNSQYPPHFARNPHFARKLRDKQAIEISTNAHATNTGTTHARIKHAVTIKPSPGQLKAL